MNLKEEVSELIEQFEMVISTAKIQVDLCKWFVDNKPSNDNDKNLIISKKRLAILERNLGDFQWEWEEHTLKTK